MDILILGGHAGCVFVSKDNLGHGLIHWLADQNSTIYVSRESRHAAKDQAAAIANALESEQPVAVFPEGTTGPGTELLPFRSALLEAAALASKASKDVAIRPVALDYGSATRDVAWWQEPGWQYIRRVLGRRGALPVTVHLLEPLRHSGDRKALAQQAREAIRETLASSQRVTPLYPAIK
jgi:lyso-ornithine lipid O-acyltransferase